MGKSLQSLVGELEGVVGCVEMRTFYVLGTLFTEGILLFPVLGSLFPLKGNRFSVEGFLFNEGDFQYS